ncbi:MAG: YggS family pyridoxal phosphate-dependent enzyme [Alphaproteobacteria bacterium]|nr:YggS family pyridoxal phosphate-dependent enzyme [Alphaproteobacteria bacterium]
MSISENLQTIRAKIPASVTLVAVSKTVDEPRLREALAAGHRVYGENYVQEAKSKWTNLKSEFPDTKLHLIGHLQSNKADDAVALFDRIDTLDRVSLASALAKSMAKQGRKVPCLIEVNIGDEPQKSGCAVAELPALIDVARGLGIEIEGLMCIPPINMNAIRSVPSDDGTTARAETIDPATYFEKLAQLAKANQLKTISMGMSADYETAIECGSTEIRVGTGIFGRR